MIGLAYGVRHRLPGIKIHNYTAWKFGIPFMLVTEIDWRVPFKNNSYFNLEFAKGNVVRIAQFDLGAAAGFKRIRSTSSGMVEQFYCGPAYLAWTYSVRVQYAYQYQQVNSEDPSRQQGIRMEVYKEFASLFDVTACYAYWPKSWQYSVSVKYNPFGSAFYFATAFEQMGIWEEVSISVLCRY